MVQFAELQLELGVEGLLVAVLPGTGLLTHGDLDSHALYELQVLLRLILRTLVAVEYLREPLSTCDGIERCHLHKLPVVSFRDGEPQDFLGVAVDHSSQVEEGVPDFQVGEVGEPDDVRLDGA